MDFERFNPVPGAVASRAEAMSSAKAGALAGRAEQAAPACGATGPNARRAALTRAAAALTTQISGEDHSLRQARLHRLGLARTRRRR